MYYRLKEPWAFCGWKGMPYAIRAMDGTHKHDPPKFLDREAFLALLYCNGEEELVLSELPERIRRMITQMLEEDVLEQSDHRLTPLQSWQRYQVYPARYRSSVHWSVTGRCNFRCRHCLVSAPEAQHPELPLSDCLYIVDEIAACGITRVDLTGGEPLVRRDFEEIVKALSRHHIDIGILFTNASLLEESTLDMLEYYHQRPVFQLSFDGLGHHDWLRGVKGAQKQADAAFALLRKRSLTVRVAMMIHRKNRGSLRDTIHYLADYGVEDLGVNAPLPLGAWAEHFRDYALSEEETWETYREAIRWFFEDGMPLTLELDGYFWCQKGSTQYRIPYVRQSKTETDRTLIPRCESVNQYIYIGADGRLSPCMSFADTELKNIMPSVLEEHLGTLTLRGPYREVAGTSVADFLANNEECAACEHALRCWGGCMAGAMACHGDYMARDDRSCYFFRHVGEQAVRETADRAITETQDTVAKTSS